MTRGERGPGTGSLLKTARTVFVFPGFEPRISFPSNQCFMFVCPETWEVSLQDENARDSLFMPIQFGFLFGNKSEL